MGKFIVGLVIFFALMKMEVLVMAVVAFYLTLKIISVM